MSRRHASGSTATTNAPSRCSKSDVRNPTTPRLKTTTAPRVSARASNVIWSAVSTIGNSVAARGDVEPSATTEDDAATNTSWWGWNAKTTVPSAISCEPVSTTPTQLYPYRNGYANVPPSAPSDSSSG